MNRVHCLIGLLALSGASWGEEPRPRAGYSPFTPGVQNQPPVQVPLDSAPFTPGVQNNTTWNNGSNWNTGNSGNWNQGNWNSGSQHWQHQQPTWQSQPQRWSYNQRQYQPTQTSYPTAPAVSYSGDPILISMPAEQPGMCSYILTSGDSSWNYTIAPGKKQSFVEDRSWKITFDRGNGYGEQSYRLAPGQYLFRQSDRGWELYHTPLAPTVDVGGAPPPPR